MNKKKIIKLIKNIRRILLITYFSIFISSVFLAIFFIVSRIAFEDVEWFLKGLILLCVVLMIIYFILTSIFERMGWAVFLREVEKLYDKKREKITFEELIGEKTRLITKAQTLKDLGKSEESKRAYREAGQKDAEIATKLDDLKSPEAKIHWISAISYELQSELLSDIVLGWIRNFEKRKDINQEEKEILKKIKITALKECLEQIDNLKRRK